MRPSAKIKLTLTKDILYYINQNQNTFSKSLNEYKLRYIISYNTFKKILCEIL